MPRRPARKPVAHDASPEGSTWSRPIHDWPVGERPRERLLLHGPGALTDAELVAVLLGNGSRGADAVATGRALLAKAGSVGRLLADADELDHVPGVGPVKRARLMASMELARRSLGEDLANLPKIRCMEDCFNFLKAKLKHLHHEVFCCMFLDTRHRVLGFEILSEGTIDEASVYNREIIRACLRHHASCVILVHNHPSGDASPSMEDVELTEYVREALEVMEIRLLDHIVVGAGKPVSMKKKGMM